jgi:hypothetical protein
MNLKYNDLNRLAQSLPCDVSIRSKVLACGVALALAYKLPLPSGPVADPDNFYNMQVSALVNDPMSEINEGVVFDLKAAVEYCRTFWLMRNAAAHDGGQFVFAQNSPYGFFDTILGAGIYVGDVMHTFVNEQKIGIWQVRNLVWNLMGDYCSEAING